MTIIIGARCKDGVALVADKRIVRVGGMELGTPECKLRLVGGVVIGRVGVSPVMDAIERSVAGGLPEGRSVANAWDVAEVAEVVAEKYKALEADSSPIFPVADVVDGKAGLYQVSGGAPPCKISYESWGRGQEYGGLGRLFAWGDISVAQGWKIIVLFVAVAARVSLAVGDGMDVVLVRDGGGFEFVDEAATSDAWKKAETLVGRLPEIIMGEMGKES
jgi:hypothetical protein